MRLFEPGEVRVKICGITTLEDARLCIVAGADALGFNFYSGSVRCISPADFDWIRGLAGSVDRVAVVVNPTRSLLKELRESGCFEMIQFHGDETPEECGASGGSEWIKAVRVRDVDVMRESLVYSTPHILLDAWSPSAYGGTGEVADWAKIRDFVAEHPSRNFILAGGLKPNNVGEAIQMVAPIAVDVAGGVECAPGRKDPELVSAFIAAAKCR
jgi:phosphoribosylanthranilate isomerase